jgi:hypothetical protein
MGFSTSLILKKHFHPAADFVPGLRGNTYRSNGTLYSTTGRYGTYYAPVSAALEINKDHDQTLYYEMSYFDDNFDQRFLYLTYEELPPELRSLFTKRVLLSDGTVIIPPQPVAPVAEPVVNETPVSEGIVDEITDDVPASPAASQKSFAPGYYSASLSGKTISSNGKSVTLTGQYGVVEGTAQDGLAEKELYRYEVFSADGTYSYLPVQYLPDYIRALLSVGTAVTGASGSDKSTLIIVVALGIAAWFLFGKKE